MELPIIAGRETEWRDRPSSPPVAVVSELFAKLNFGQQNPLGQHIVLNPAHRSGIENRPYGCIAARVSQLFHFLGQGKLWSKTRFSSRTFTRGSPSIPN